MTAFHDLFQNIGYIPGTTNCGLVTDSSDGKTEGYLIDSGGCPEDGKRLFSYLSEKHITLKAVINTHSHADHCGGNAFLVQHTGCEIWSSFLEKGSMENTLMQPSVAWGGFPLPELLTPYYIAEKSVTDKVISEKDSIRLCDGKTISFAELPGHYFGQLGVIVTASDGKKVLFGGDSFFGREVMAKYWIPFLYDVRAFKASLDKLVQIHADVYVPSHGKSVTEIAETAELNKIAVLSTETCIVNILKKNELTTDELIKAVADSNEIPMKLAQYVLIGCTLRSYLSYLSAEKRITCRMYSNRLLWSAVQ